MGLFQHIVYNKGGTVALDYHADLTTPKINIFTDSNDAIVSAQSANQSSVDTTISDVGGISAGATSMTVASASNISFNQRLWLSEKEEIIVGSISGTTITFMRPTVYSHANGAAVNCFRMSYAVSADEASELFFDGRIEWLDGTTVIALQPINCTRYMLDNLTGLQDVLDIDADFLKKISPRDDITRMINNAWSDIITELTGRLDNQQNLFWASGREFARAVAFKALANRYVNSTKDAERELRKEYLGEVDRRLAIIINSLPVDKDQNQKTSDDTKQSFYTVRLTR